MWDPVLLLPPSHFRHAYVTAVLRCHGTLGSLEHIFIVSVGIMLLGFPLICVCVYELCPWGCPLPEQATRGTIVVVSTHTQRDAWASVLSWAERSGLLQGLHSLVVPVSPVSSVPTSTLSKVPAQLQSHVLKPNAGFSFQLREKTATSWVQA